MWEELMAIKEKGDEVAYRAALLDTLQRFMHKGQLVKAEGIEGPCSHRNGRTGLILHNLQDEQGRFTIEFNDFKYDNSGELMQTWLRLPPTNIRLQVGMVPGLFGDFSYEKELVKKGKMKLPKRGEKDRKKLPHEGREKDDIIDITDSRKAKEASEESGRSTGRYSDGRWIDKNDPRRYGDSQYIDKDGMIRGGYDDPVRPPPADVGARDARSKPTVGYDGGALESIGEKPW